MFEEGIDAILWQTPQPESCKRVLHSDVIEYVSRCLAWQMHISYPRSKPGDVVVFSPPTPLLNLTLKEDQSPGFPRRTVDKLLCFEAGSNWLLLRPNHPRHSAFSQELPCFPPTLCLTCCLCPLYVKGPFALDKGTYNGLSSTSWMLKTVLT